MKKKEIPAAQSVNPAPSPNISIFLFILWMIEVCYVWIKFNLLDKEYFSSHQIEFH